MELTSGTQKEGCINAAQNFQVFYDVLYFRHTKKALYIYFNTMIIQCLYNEHKIYNTWNDSGFCSVRNLNTEMSLTQIFGFIRDTYMGSAPS